MTCRLSTVVAATHPPRYRLHKYWSRKPYNVIRSFVEDLLSTPGVVVDPYVGSGVTAWEAANLGHQVYASDVNPIAVRLATLTTGPPDAEAFLNAMNDCLHQLEEDVRSHWATEDGVIRYAVHEMQSSCPGCSKTWGVQAVTKSGRSRLCPECGTSMSFNLEAVAGTRVIGAVIQGHPGVNTDPDRLMKEQERSACWFGGTREGPLFSPMTVNRRILSFPDMVAADLFTPRSLSTLLRFRQLVLECEDEAIQNCGLLMLTASSAQCSRLTAFRNNLSTGGPAWSVPGFWVPPTHIETNPVLHLQARLKRFVSGLKDLTCFENGPSAVQIRPVSADELLSSLHEEGIRADLIILDPPYGDSVPFTEFSSFWNALLREEANLDDDISVSDRMNRAVSWQKYRRGLGDMFKRAHPLLSENGHILLTFNNNDSDAWAALYGEAQAAGFGCDDAKYQLPAVVSSKAAFHPQGSYVGDIWAVLSRRDASWEPSRDLGPAQDALARVAAFRAGRVAINLVQRTLALTWLAHNIDAEMIATWPDLMDELFEKDGKHILVYKADLPPDVPIINDMVMTLGREFMARGECQWKELYTSIATRCADLGVPDASEIRQILAPKLVMAGTKVLHFREDPPIQTSLFG